jgi:polysaccharide deacetylase family protein (PEP-CTERM system associated)
MNILTFDIEEWFHILDNDFTKHEHQWDKFESRIHRNVDIILKCLAKYKTNATFFCLGWIAEKYPEIIREIDSYGHEIACHSFSHQLAYQLSNEEFKEDLKKSCDSIQQITGKKVNAYRAPGFSFTENNICNIESLIDFGIEVDCSIFPISRAHGGFKNFGSSLPSIIKIKDLTIKEFPLNTYSFAGSPIVFTGGGYFRLFPYFLISYWMKKTAYSIFYFHPRDFDPAQPVLKGLSLFRKFKSYVGLNSSLDKLDRILNDYTFVDVSTAVKNTDWSSVKIISL